MVGTLIGYFCALCAALTISPNATYDANSEGALNVLGAPIGRYVDNEQPNQCQSVTAEKVMGWPIVIAGQAPYSNLTCLAR